jgi:2,3-bisphosphoglycerate-dependent phosphoglycerate mutase
MYRILKQVVLLIFIISVLPDQSEAQSSGEITTFILVRHAEKVDDSRDPDLSEEGYKRAALFERMLENIQFDAVYSTPFIRTRETARPISERHQLTIQEYDHRNPENTAAEWREKHRGQYVLVAGHSNSTPAFANALLGREHFSEKFDESDYGNILIVTITAEGESHLLHMRF